MFQILYRTLSVYFCRRTSLRIKMIQNSSRRQVRTVTFSVFINTRFLLVYRRFLSGTHSYVSLKMTQEVKTSLVLKCTLIENVKFLHNIVFPFSISSSKLILERCTLPRCNPWYEIPSCTIVRNGDTNTSGYSSTSGYRLKINSMHCKVKNKP